MILDLAAIGNSWYTNIVPLPTKLTEIQQMLQINNPLKNSTQISILALTKHFNWTSYFSLLRQVLHGGIYMFQHLNTEAQLNNAPCDGTFCHTSTDKAGNSWAAERRFASDLGEQNNGPSFDFGNYPGLDYMLLHNLYYLVSGKKDSKGNTLPKYQNLIDYPIENDFPFIIIPGASPIIMGSHDFPITVSIFRSIKSQHKVYPGGNVTFRAGESIDLLPGFEVQLGANFEAYIVPITCDNP